MNVFSNQLEALLWENATFCKARGLDIAITVPDGYSLTLYRQLNLLPFGYADIVALYISDDAKFVVVDIFNLKQREINLATFAQSCKYETAIRECLTATLAIENTDVSVRHYLIGNSIDVRNDFHYLIHQAEQDYHREIYLYTYNGQDINDIKFTRFYKDELVLANLIKQEELKSFELRRDLQVIVERTKQNKA